MTYDASSPLEREAYEEGRAAAVARASWVADGNSDADSMRRMLRWCEEGDGRFQDRLPARPDLSGEWAGLPTPTSLARGILGRDPEGDEEERAADAYEEAVSDHFEQECERLLRVALGE